MTLLFRQIYVNHFFSKLSLSAFEQLLMVISKQNKFILILASFRLPVLGPSQHEKTLIPSNLIDTTN